MEAHKKYPVAARRMRQEGSCQRAVILSRDGGLKGVETLSSCGHDSLDQAATGAIRAVGNYPPFPAELSLHEARFNVTITFGLSR
nr:energy transducer TonB [Geomonas sp. RF6]